MRRIILLAFLLVLLIMCLPGAAYAGSWNTINLGGSNYVKDGALAPDGSLWVGTTSGKIFRVSGGSAQDVTGSYNGGGVYRITASKDGSVYAVGYSSLYKYSSGSWSYLTYCNGPNVYDLITDSNNKVWVSQSIDSRFELRYWDGTTLVQALRTSAYYNNFEPASDGTLWTTSSNGTIYQFINGTPYLRGTLSEWIADLAVSSDNRVFLVGYTNNQIYQYVGGSTWNAVVSGVPYSNNGCSLSIDADGRFWVFPAAAGASYFWNGTSWESRGTPGHWSYAPQSAGPGTDGSIWAWSNWGSTNTVGRYVRSNPLSLVPAPNGTTGQMPVRARYESLAPMYAVIQASSDGMNFTDLGTTQNGSDVVFTPTANQYWFRLRWTMNDGGFGTGYSNTVGPIPTILSPTTIVNSGIVSWDSARGRSWVNLSYPTANATGYKIHIFDGNTYRTRDLGNLSSWDSRTAKIFPFSGSLPENNGISTDLFLWDGSGLNLEDSAKRLYRTTVGTSYDNNDNYTFKITAYNQWMETSTNAPSALQTPTLSNATDSQAPTGTIAVVSQEGLEKTYNTSVNVTVSITDSMSGVRRVDISNDNTTYTNKFEAALCPDNSTGLANYSNTLNWDLPLGAGTKMVYVRVTDGAGNQRILTDSVALAEDMLAPTINLSINNGSSTTTNFNVTLTIASNDNVSIESELQMRFSNDGTNWSPWEPFSVTRAWNVSSGYGGVNTAGVKKVFVRVCDAAQNIGLGTGQIVYNPVPPAGTLTVTGGTTGTFDGKPSTFTKSGSLSLILTYSDASEIRFDTGTGQWSEWETYAAIKSVYLDRYQGVCRFRYQIKDSYGAPQAPQEKVLVIDPIPPTIQVFRGVNRATATRGSSATLELKVSDNMPGTLLYQYKVNGGSPTAWANIVGNSMSVSGLGVGANYIDLFVKDFAGNVASSNVLIWGV